MKYKYKNIKYQGNFVPYKLDIRRAYYNKISSTNDKRNAYEFFSISFFQIQQKLEILCLSKLGYSLANLTHFL